MDMMIPRTCRDYMTKSIECNIERNQSLDTFDLCQKLAPSRKCSLKVKVEHIALFDEKQGAVLRASPQPN